MATHCLHLVGRMYIHGSQRICKLTALKQLTKWLELAASGVIAIAARLLVSSGATLDHQSLLVLPAMPHPPLPPAEWLLPQQC